MADIAQIGFSADTSALVKAERALDNLSPAASKAENSVANLNQELMETGNAAQQASVGLNKADTAADKAAKGANDASSAFQREIGLVDKLIDSTVRLGGATDQLAAAQGKLKASVPIIRNFASPWQNVNNVVNAANDNVKGFNANVGNIAAQFQDIGVTAAMGMNPLLIALQQGTQLSAVFAQAMQQGQTATQALMAAFRQVIGVTALVTIGIVALAAGLIQLVPWTKVAQVALNGIAEILPDIATYAVAAGAALALAFAPAILSAFWTAFLGLSAAIIGGVGTIVATIGAIPLAIGLIIADLIIFRDEWAQVLGVDIVGYAKTGVNYIIGAFVGAYHDIEFLWKQFPDVIGAAAIGAANFAIQGVNLIIGSAVSGLNTLVRAVNSFMNVGGLGDKLGFKGFSEFDPKAGQFDTVANDAADRLANAVQTRNGQLEKDLTTDYLGAIGGAIESAASTAADKIKKFSAGLGIDDKKKKKRGGGKTDEEKYDDIVAGAERQIATLQAQKDALGLSAEAAARLKYETQLLNEAQQKNITLSPEQEQALKGLAAEMANLEVSTQKAKEALDFAKGLTKDFVNDLASGLKEGQSFWEAFGNAALNVLDKIVDKLLNDVINALFEVNSASGGGGGGFWSSVWGAISGIFGGGGKASGGDPWAGMRLAKGGVLPNVSGYSNQVVTSPTMFAFASGTGLMGEAGPEAVMPLTRMNNGDLGVSFSGMSGAANNNQPVPVNINVRVDGANGDKHVIDLVNQGVQAGLQQFNEKVLPERVNEISYDSRVR